MLLLPFFVRLRLNDAARTKFSIWASEGAYILPPYQSAGEKGSWFSGTANAIYQNIGFIENYDPDNVPDLESDTSGKYEGVYLNRFTQSTYIPGSIFKIVTLAAALEEFPDAQQMQFNCKGVLELPGGKVLLAYGQNPSARRILIFDPDWLTETARSDDFRYGLGNLSTHLYVKSCTGGWRGWAGHCAWNRVPGALLVRDPHMDSLPPGAKPSNRDVLQLCRIRDDRLV